MKLILKNIAENNIKDSELSSNWQDFDFEKFSKDKKLYDFQIEALKNAIKILWFYYEKSYDYKENENLEINDKRKESLYEEYLLFGDLEPDKVAYKKKEERKHKFIFYYYPSENDEISFKHFVNRMSFWMATGSGKTLVIIKLIEILKKLIKKGEIPDYDILFLTHREDLINQFKKHLEEYNKSNPDINLKVYDFKEYEKIKNKKQLFNENVIFCYRSDLFSDEEKEKLVNFANYHNEGKWYLILDEAHKGDKEESKRQHIFSILSKNGFLFNFSATFDDIRDLVSCVYEFNLKSFIEEGYGKKIYLFEEDLSIFKDKNDFDDLSKQKIVLKALILLAYIKKNLEKIRELNSNLYHKPLILVLVNSVNNELADLKKFFEVLKKIGEGKLEEKEKMIEEAKDEIFKEFSGRKNFIIPENKNEDIKLNLDFLNNISYEDILKYVFNSEKPGEIEISFNPSNRSEVAFKLKTSDSHFCLSKTGDMPDWLKNELSKFDVNHTFEEEGYFKRINEEESSINILLGSRVFYEGWDSNRPNIILFVNIGVQKEAKKFVLQSIGRGIRIEPVKNKRKRMKYLNELREIFDKVKDYINPIESLFIFGTNKSALETILKNLEEFKKQAGEEKEISLHKNEENIEGKLLLIPKYKISNKKFFEAYKEKAKFKLAEEELKIAKEFYEFINDDRILIINYEIEPKLLEFVKNSFKNVKDFYKYYNYKDKAIKDPIIIFDKIFSFWRREVNDFELKELSEEIIHYKKIVVELKEISSVDFDGFKDLINKVIEKKEGNKFFRRDLILKYIPQHYYNPLILKINEKVDYIKHIIKTESEFYFIDKLEKYMENENNKFKNFDWWLFSKIDENLDDIYIPYYDYATGKFMKFYPDFIFWLQKGNNYYIIFIDPKGTSYRDFENKILGYKELFEESENNKPKKLTYNGLNCYVYCYLYTEDKNKVESSGYKNYWFENFDEILDILEKKYN